MRNLLEILFVLSISLWLFSCAATNVDNVNKVGNVPESQAFQGIMSIVWKATIRALSEHEVIKTMDENVGFVTTEYDTVDNRELDALKTALGAKTYKYNYTVNLSKENASETKVKIIVNLLTQQIGFFTRTTDVPWLKNHLRQKLFFRICDNLKNYSDRQCNTMFSNVSRNPHRQSQIQKSNGDNQIMGVQIALQEAGYNPGPADGIMGRKTRSALRIYQKDNNIGNTGKIDDETMVSLGLKPGSMTQEKTKQEQIVNSPNKTSVDDQYVTTKSTELKLGKEVFSETILVLPGNAQLTLLERGEEWCKVSHGDKTGYVYASFISPGDSGVTVRQAGNSNPVHVAENDISEEPVQWEKAEPRPVPQDPVEQGLITQNTHLMANASIMADSLMNLPSGTTLDLIERQDNFYKVNHKGQEGFVYADFVRKK